MSWLGALQASFLLAEAESSGVKVSRFHGETDEAREAPHSNSPPRLLLSGRSSGVL
jgi:hypothetical protein